MAVEDTTWSSSNGIVDINRASEAELKNSLFGIGSRKSEAIVKARQAVGSFSCIDDLLSVTGISPTLVDQNRDRLMCDSPVTRSLTKGSPGVSRRPRALYKSGGTKPPLMKRKSCCGGDVSVSPGKRTRSQSIEQSVDMEESSSLNDGVSPLKSASPISNCNSPEPLHSDVSSWLQTFKHWNYQKSRSALDYLIETCSVDQVRHMLAEIEPRFQRDFITNLPKELSLHVLSYLDPINLCRAAQVCHYWRLLCEDQLLWRDKCKEEGIEHSASIEPPYWTRRYSDSPTIPKSSWKLAFLRRYAVNRNWRQGTNRPTKTLKGHEDHVITCLQFNGDIIISGSDDNTLKVWSANSGECLRTLVGHTGGVWSSQMAGDIVVSGSTDRTLKVWSTETGECLHTLYGHTSTVRCMALHSKLIVSGSRDATLRIWSIDSGECLHILIGHVAAVRCVQYDGKFIVSGAYDFSVKVWNGDTEECIHSLQGHTNRVYSLQFDGVHIVSGSLDTTIKVWNAESGECLHTLIGHQSLTSGMELKDNILVSGNADSTVKVWDIESGQCLHTLAGSNKHLSAVTSLQFTNKFVLTSSDDGTVKIWDIKTGEFIRNLVVLESGGSGGVVWRVKCSDTKLVCAVGSRNGTEETKLVVLNFDIDEKARNSGYVFT